MSDTVAQTDPRASYLAHQDAIDAALRRVLASGRYILGDEVAAFERELARYIGSRHCVGLASGTDALIAAVRMLAPAPKDHVITVSHTSVATVAAIEAAGAAPLLIDVEPDTLTIDPVELSEVLEHPPGHIAAIIVVHLYGHPADMDTLLPLARRHGVPLIEDCAQSHGATLAGKRVGSLGDMGAFSFYPTKNLGAMGDGGALVLDDPERCECLRAYRQYGWKTPQISELAGTCSRLDELQAAILRAKLVHLDEDNARRRLIATAYRAGLQGLPLAHLPERPGARSVFHQYVVRSSARDALRALLSRLGVGTGIHYPVPVHLQPAYRGRIALGPSGLAHSEHAAREVLSLPIYPQLPPEQVDHVITAVKDACREIV
jgi:dTDP-4-amino-4,6-dideoxygalactose transaminase